MNHPAGISVARPAPHVLIQQELAALARHIGYAQPLQVRLLEVGGSGGAPMRCCLIAAEDLPGGPVVVTAVDRRWQGAIRDAFAKLRRRWLRAFRRELERA